MTITTIDTPGRSEDQLAQPREINERRLAEHSHITANWKSTDPRRNCRGSHNKGVTLHANTAARRQRD